MPATPTRAALNCAGNSGLHGPARLSSGAILCLNGCRAGRAVHRASFKQPPCVLQPSSLFWSQKSFFITDLEGHVNHAKLVRLSPGDQIIIFVSDKTRASSTYR